MKKNFLYAAAMTLCMSFAATACSDDNNDNGGNTGGSNVEEIDITAENAFRLLPDRSPLCAADYRRLL